MFDYHKIAFCGEIVNCEISRIPEIENDEQREALILFREANSVNNDYLSFLFFCRVKIMLPQPIFEHQRIHHLKDLI